MHTGAVMEILLVVAAILFRSLAVPTGVPQISELNTTTATNSPIGPPIQDISTLIAIYEADDFASIFQQLAKNITLTRNGSNLDSILPTLANSISPTPPQNNESTTSSLTFNNPSDGYVTNWKHWTQRFHHYRTLRAPVREVQHFADYLLVIAHTKQVEAHAVESDTLPTGFALFSGRPPQISSSMSLYIRKNNARWTWGDYFAVIGLFRRWTRQWDVGRIPSCDLELYDLDRNGVNVATGTFVVTGTSGSITATPS